MWKTTLDIGENQQSLLAVKNVLEKISLETYQKKNFQK